MSLSDIVTVNISATSRGVSRKSFGVPLVAAYHTKWMDLYKVYSSSTVLSDMVTDGFTVYDPAYISVRSLVQASPKVPNVVVGRLSTVFEHSGTITVATGTPVAGKIYRLNVISPAGVLTAVSYTAIAGNTESDVATALAALITAISGITATATLAVISWAADVDGTMWRFTGYDPTLLWYEDTTVDSSLAANLTAIKLAYPDFYGLVLADAQSDARITAIAAVTEAEERIFAATTYSTENVSASTGNIGAALRTADYFRTYVKYSGDQTADSGARWMGGQFAKDPGSSTWAYKSLSGVIVDNLNATQISNLETNNTNYYIELNGVPITLNGRMASGEWIDTIRGRDWLVARLRERQLSLLVNNPKIPYTDAGISILEASVTAQLAEGVSQGYLSGEGDDAPIVTAPKASDASAADKIDRIVRNINFQAVLAGAVHKMVINGTVSAGGVA